MPSRSSPSTRLAVLALSLAVSAACVWWLMHRLAARPGVEIVGIGDDVRELFSKRASEGTPPTGPSPGTDAVREIVREPIDEATAKTLFPSIKLGDVFDPALYYRRPSNESRRYRLDEYPDGGFTKRTNSLGMREDSEPLATRPDWRVLVAGASNVECVCDNASSATNLIEAMLQKRMPGKTVEALNTGCGGYSFYNDLAVLERYRELHPDVFVLVAYGGNDFLGCVRLQRYFNHRGVPNDGPRHNTGLEQAEKFTRELAGTEIGQVVYFLNNPDDVEIAARTLCDLTAAMERICRADGIRFVCAYLPPPLSGQPQLLGDVRETVMGSMRLTVEDLAISDRLADRWIDCLERLEIAHVDLRAKFRKSRKRLYWTTDTHVNLDGQKAIAHALMPLVQPKN